MIPYQMLRTDPRKALVDSGFFPQTTFGHFERNYARMQGAHRLQDLNANLRRNDDEMLKQHYTMRRPMLVHRRPMPSIA